jgi:hypothetical protein
LFGRTIDGQVAHVRGVTHIMLRFAGDHERHLEIASKIKRDLGW